MTSSSGSVTSTASTGERDDFAQAIADEFGGPMEDRDLAIYNYSRSLHDYTLKLLKDVEVGRANDKANRRTRGRRALSDAGKPSAAPEVKEEKD